MRTISRFEHKYRLEPSRYYQLKNALMPYIEADYFTKCSPDKAYLVRSLYFDTFDYTAYREKDDGDYGRIKLRIRTYDDIPTEDTRLSVELKTRTGNAMKKYSVFVSLKEYQSFMDTWHWPENSNPVLIEFERLLHLKAYRPKTVVEYKREGFRSRDEQPLRITFDHNVRSFASEDLFMKDRFYKPHANDAIIFEIKCGMQRPSWLLRIIRQHGLKLVSNSKYAQSIEAARPDIAPSGYLREKVERTNEGRLTTGSYKLGI